MQTELVELLAFIALIVVPIWLTAARRTIIFRNGSHTRPVDLERRALDGQFGEAAIGAIALRETRLVAAAGFLVREPLRSSRV